MIKNKKIILGITGGIAAYKSAELARLLTKAGAQVKTAMTAHAVQFIAPLTLETLTGNPVIIEMFSKGTGPLDHINWAQKCDLIIIAPATANFIGKMAHGLGDDFLSTLILAATAKVLVCPSMNTEMWQKQVVQANIKLLRERGYGIMAPAAGELACGTDGPGRMAEPAEILGEVQALLSEQDLAGLKIMVTAGPTMERIDPVRFISNRSSGKMGYALARAAYLRGAEVVLVSGPTHIEAPRHVRTIQVKTAEEMRKAVLEWQAGCDIIIKAAAVLDYSPAEPAARKIKKEEVAPLLKLVRTPDILSELGQSSGKPGRILVGFAAETHDLLAHARAKVEKKNLDMIVVNDVSRPDAGFDVDTNAVKIVYRNGLSEDLPLMTKEELADQLLYKIKEIWQKRA